VRTVTAPIDRVKLILQTQGANRQIIDTGRFYNGPRDCFKRVIKEEGLKALWVGNISNVIRFVPTQASTFAFKDWLRVYKTDNNSNLVDELANNFILGGLSGALSLCCVYPLDFARTRLAADIREEFKGMINCIVKVYKSDGFFGLYRGFGVSVIGIFIYRALHFGLFDTLSPRIAEPTLLKKSTLSAVICFISVFISYPLDTVRRRLKLQAGEEVRMYKGAIDCMLKTSKKEGIKGFFGGYVIKSSTAAILSIGHVLFDTPE